ncbi:acetyl-CoA synthetase [Nematocida homosporus]|uniref:acetyl-CoA synthetase n=1 Tax=Nematocida homosporus TaxID=1912981 RepID=UPI00221FF400|nr:acetyl-CoA synthetase [Nematocida homosporus]KAI5185006.1 acetyl-CoA synthetase [Nematocida homosporus]
MKSVFEHGKHLRANYYREHKRSLEAKEAFFAEQARILLSFTKDFTEVMNIKSSPTQITWFADGELNACYNAVDRHAEVTPDKIAIIHETDDEKTEKLTYADLKTAVIRFANYLVQSGVKQGETVCLYMPMEPKALIASLACARLGVAHTVVFGGFSSDSLALRIEDSDATWLVTADKTQRGGRTIEYLPNVVAAVTTVLSEKSPSLRGVLLCDQSVSTRDSTVVQELRDKIKVDLLSELDMESPELNRDRPCVSVPAESVLFHLYTSGSTGRPKGLSHSTAGYLLYAALTTLVCFDVQENDVFFCTAELGWITGHSYVLYGPLVLGATTVVFSGIPTFPDPLRLFRSVARHRATHLYTAPTVVRLLQKSLPTYLVRPMDLSESTDDLTPAVDHVPDSPASTRSIFSHGITGVFCSERYTKEYPADSLLRQIDLSSLRVLGSVGEPINKGAYVWFSMFFGNGQLPLIDTYWQTEAGGVMLSPLIDVTLPKPESASFPFFGMQPLIIKKNQDKLEEEPGVGVNGLLVFKGFWPGIARTIVKNHERYESAYFPYPGHFYTGDEACRDEDGYFWIRGRVDDVINVSGHRLSTAEIESAVCSVPGIAEAAALGQEDEVTGQSVCIFVVKTTEKDDQALAVEIKQALRKKIGAVVAPKRIITCPELPKTSTGKMMRRVLRSLLEGKEVGDISTCINPDAISIARSNLCP